MLKIGHTNANTDEEVTASMAYDVFMKSGIVADPNALLKTFHEVDLTSKAVSMRTRATIFSKKTKLIRDWVRGIN